MNEQTEPVAGTEPQERVDVSKSEWAQAARELKARADEARWLLRLSEIVGDFGELDKQHKRLERDVAGLEKRNTELMQTIAAARDQAEEIVNEARRKADDILAGAGQQRAELEATEEMLRKKIAERNKEFGEIDRKYRDLRGKLNRLSQEADEGEGATA